MLRELGQVGALLLILLFCPKQNLRNLEKEVNWMELEPCGFPAMVQFLSSRDRPQRLTGPGRALPQPRSTPYLYFIKELGI